MMNTNEVLKALKWRYATKVFDKARKIPTDVWNVLEQSLLLSPSSYGLQPWKFVVVQNAELRQKLRAVSWNQPQVTDSSHFVVLLFRETIDEAYISEFIARTAEVRGMKVEQLEGYRRSMMGDLVEGPRAKVIESWAQRQSYIAMGFLMQTAALLEVDTCALEGFDPQAYDQLLKLSGSGYKSIVAVALGYRSADDKSQSNLKVRFSKEKVIEWFP